MFDPGIGAGVYEITYTFMEANGCTGMAIQSITVLSSEVNNISGFILVNADTDQDIMTLEEGSIIELNSLTTSNLNIRAESTADVESVQLQLSGAMSQNRNENVAPYALFGDLSGDYLPAEFAAGDYTLTATPYTGNNLSGTAGLSKTINFSVVEGSSGGFFLKLYPNPAVTEIQVELASTTEKSEIFAIQVHDMNGRLMRSYQGTEIPDGSEFKMPTQTMPAGVYYMTVYGNLGTVQKKTFVVNK